MVGAVVFGGAVSLAGAAQAGTTVVKQAPVASGVQRTFPTGGLTRFNLGGGVTVFTNTPGGVSSFSWNTGAGSGIAINIGK